jgi:hypothetical protein
VEISEPNLSQLSSLAHSKVLWNQSTVARLRLLLYNTMPTREGAQASPLVLKPKNRQTHCL